MKQRLSAMMDDAAAGDECERCAKRLKDDPELRAAWDVYHLIGDALRGHTAPDVAQRVQERLAAEPTVFAPRAIEPPRRRAAWVGLSMAASVAAAALVGWMALPLFERQPDALPPITVKLPEPVPVAHGVGDYLLAHQPFSPALAIGGIAPYIRSVSEENGAR
ncbi:MAG: sigma-E factor negative regulatory protein [Burkholderiales bacterium]